MSLRVTAYNSRLVARLKLIYLLPIGLLILPFVGIVCGIWDQLIRLRRVLEICWWHQPTRQRTGTIRAELKEEVEETTSVSIKRPHRDGADPASS